MKIPAFFSILLIPFVCLSQNVFEKNYGGIDNDKAFGIIETYDGNYIFTGETRSTLSYKQIVYTVKINSIGNIIWTRTEEIDDSRGLSIIETQDQGFVVAGEILLDNDYVPLLLKYDAFGNLLWSYDYHEIISGSGAYKLVERSNGELSFTCNDGNAACVLNVSANGEYLWKKNFNMSNKLSYGLCTSYDDGLVASGSMDTEGGGSYRNSWLVKLDSEHNISWQETYGGDYSRSGLYDIKEKPDHGFIACGAWFSGNVILHGKMYLVNLDENGDLLWERFIEGNNDEDDYRGIAVEAMEDAYLACGNYREQYSMEKIFVAKYDLNGDTLWLRTYGGEYTDNANAIISTSDGGFLICGYTQNNTLGGSDAYLIKADSEGHIVGNTSLTSTSGIEIFPNPTKNHLRIKFDGAESKVIICSIDGKIVFQRSFTQNESTEHYLDMRNISKGTYIISISTPNNSFQQKLIKL
jgi:hypothetical protein